MQLYPHCFSGNWCRLLDLPKQTAANRPFAPPWLGYKEVSGREHTLAEHTLGMLLGFTIMPAGVQDRRVATSPITLPQSEYRRTRFLSADGGYTALFQWVGQLRLFGMGQLEVLRRCHRVFIAHPEVWGEPSAGFSFPESTLRNSPMTTELFTGFTRTGASVIVGAVGTRTAAWEWTPRNREIVRFQLANVSNKDKHGQRTKTNPMTHQWTTPSFRQCAFLPPYTQLGDIRSLTSSPCMEPTQFCIINTRRFQLKPSTQYML